MTTRDDLIEQAAKAMLDDSHGEGTWEYREPLEEELYLRRAKVALTVFENAQPWEYRVVNFKDGRGYESVTMTLRGAQTDAIQDGDRILRRHPATAWEEMPNEGGEQ